MRALWILAALRAALAAAILRVRHLSPTSTAALADLPDWVCRVCGCTDDDACASACWWVDRHLCSSCHDDMIVAWSTPGGRS